MYEEIELIPRKRLLSNATSTADPTTVPIGYLEKLKQKFSKLDFLEILSLIAAASCLMAITLILIVYLFPFALPALSFGTGIYLAFSLAKISLVAPISAIILGIAGCVSFFSAGVTLIIKLENIRDDQSDFLEDSNASRSTHSDYRWGVVPDEGKKEYVPSRSPSPDNFSEIPTPHYNRW